ncbi:MAG: hypothetical protein MZV63_62600 [Marinilabiliales bacterium]|nr:hypothetical protein [Marinilabiliales bacterium]
MPQVVCYRTSSLTYHTCETICQGTVSLPCQPDNGQGGCQGTDTGRPEPGQTPL